MDNTKDKNAEDTDEAMSTNSGRNAQKGGNETDETEEYPSIH